MSSKSSNLIYCPLPVASTEASSPRPGGENEDKSRDKPTTDKSVASKRQPQGTSPDRNHPKGDNQRGRPDFSFHSSSSRDKENVSPGNSTQKKETSPAPASVKTTQPLVKKKSGEEKEKHTIRFVA